MIHILTHVKQKVELKSNSDPQNFVLILGNSMGYFKGRFYDHYFSFCTKMT